MSQVDSSKEYYEILGVDEDVSRAELDKRYKREAAKHHPDLGGCEERMKSLNEAYRVLKDSESRRAYDETRKRSVAASMITDAAPPARDVGIFGHGLSALLCVITGGFLLLLVRFQWIWFLWPLAILAVFVLAVGVLMARSALVAATAALPASNRFRRHTRVREFAFWLAVIGGGYGFYVVLTQ